MMGITPMYDRRTEYQGFSLGDSISVRMSTVSLVILMKLWGNSVSKQPSLFQADRISPRVVSISDISL